MPQVSAIDWYESKGRVDKATKLARQVYRDMLAALRGADDAMWSNIAEKAGVKPPSAETREMVLEILTARDKHAEGDGA